MDHIFPSPVTFKETGSGILSADFETAKRMVEFEKEFPEIRHMEAAARRGFFRSKIEELRAKAEAKRAEAAEANLRINELKSEGEAVDAVTEWAASLGLEKPSGISFRKLRSAVASGKTFYLAKNLDTKIPYLDFEKEVFRFAEVLVIEHDWASALKRSDIANSVVKLPYDVCAFEFQFSGRPVVALATQFDTDIVFCPAIPHGDHWILTEFTFPVNGFDMSGDARKDNLWCLFEQLALQIRAACIALDAEVATSQVVREPHTSAHGKNNHVPLKPYHVVSLARRGPRPLLAQGCDTGRRVRLHFRRGHWRHFESHKTWIRWMLVGDPDLGFIDKHYKL